MTTRPTYQDFADRRERIGVIGLGYVGLPLAHAFAAKFDVVGLDISAERVAELKAGHDRTEELTSEQLKAAKLEFTNDLAVLKSCRLVIVTVPTPIDDHKNPDLTPLVKASETVGRHLAPGTTVVYESTVYPGCTEEDCLPVIERVSGRKWGADFFAGYSPERINPGDKEHTVTKILKIVSGDNPETAELLRQVYGAVITAGIHVAPTIKAAEAAKVIENTQRDLNIALINEFAMIFNRLGIDTLEVLQAAGTKWNFLPFRPGLVGGHCIGVDPYYLTHKAQELGYHPEVILAGRRINDGMGAYVADRVLRLLLSKKINPVGARALVLGLAFKENCPDLRNTKVVDIVAELKEHSMAVDIHDPWVDAAEARHEYGVELTADPKAGDYDVVLLAVAHKQFIALGAEGIRALGKDPSVLYDVKSALPRDAVDGRL